MPPPRRAAEGGSRAPWPRALAGSSWARRGSVAGRCRRVNPLSPSRLLCWGARSADRSRGRAMGSFKERDDPAFPAPGSRSYGGSTPVVKPGRRRPGASCCNRLETPGIPGLPPLPRRSNRHRTAPARKAPIRPMEAAQPSAPAGYSRRSAPPKTTRRPTSRQGSVRSRRRASG